jgi:hypothetical protein
MGQRSELASLRGLAIARPMTNSTRWRLAENVSSVGSILCLLVACALEFHFIRSRPSVPSVSEGRVYALSVHGWVVYLTLMEHALVIGLFVTFAVLAAVAFAIDRIHNPFNR